MNPAQTGPSVLAVKDRQKPTAGVTQLSPRPPHPASNRDLVSLRKDLRLPPPFCHLPSALAPESGPPDPAHWVQEPPGGGGGRGPGPGLAWPGTRLPAETHIWCFWKSDLNSPTPALTRVHSSPGKGAVMCMRSGGCKSARTHTPLLKSPQGHLRKMGCPGLGKPGGWQCRFLALLLGTGR